MDSLLTNSSFCSSSNIIWTSEKLAALLVAGGVKGVLAFSAACSSLLLFICTFRSKRRFHINVKILLSVYSVGCLIDSTSHCGHALYMASGYFCGDVRVLCISWARCQIFLAPEIFGGVTFIVMPLVMSIERVISCRNHATYEHRTCKLSICMCALTLLVVCLSYSTNQLPKMSNHAQFCTSTDAHDNIVQQAFTLSSVACSQIVALGLCIYALRSSKALLKEFGINRARLTLSSRLQLKQSVWMTRTILPAVSITAICLSVTMIAQLFDTIFISKFLSIAWRVILYHLISVSCVMLSILLATTACIYRNTELKKEAKKIIYRCFCICGKKIEPEINSDPERNDHRNHFVLLNNFWIP